ncbi:MAG: DUF4270 family protein [Paludibacteraceae bacterium]|nr:DUF4270 family protein [Paludibacteraceae bacterium]
MSKKIEHILLGLFAVLLCVSCKNDVTSAGSAILDDEDAIIVLADTFALQSEIDSCLAIVSQADSFLLGELETDYGLMRASILTQLACPEGYSYPDEATIDSICLFMYYSSWVGDGYSPIALNAYLMDKKTFDYARTYPTDLNIDDYCSRDKSILTNHRIVVASEKLDSIANSSGKYVPMLRMRLNDDFLDYFSAIRSFDDQATFNQQFKGLLIETSFGSSTVLNVSDVALGVYYHFTYNKAGRDTTVNDMKAFYANSEVRTINHLTYRDKQEWIDSLKNDSSQFNYIVAPAGVCTRVIFPMQHMVNAINADMMYETSQPGVFVKKIPYVNMAQLQIDVENVFTGTANEKGRNDWLQPAAYMLLIREESVERFFNNKELPSDTCAILSALTQGTDSAGNTIYYYSYDLSDLLTNQLRKQEPDTALQMVLMPVSVSTGSSSAGTAITSVKQQQTMSATQIKSASNGMNLKMVYSGFSIDYEYEFSEGF